MVATATGAYATAAGLKARLGIGDTTDDTALGLVCDQVNQFIESPNGTGRIIAPISSATYLIDGDGTSTIYFPKGIRAITALSLGDFTGDTLDLLAATDYYLRPLVQDRHPGWPAMYVVFSNLPAGTHHAFHEGRETISMTCTAGWAAIPDDIIDVALTTATRMWHGIQAGQSDIVGTDEMGAPIISRFVAPFHWGTIKAYRLKQPAVPGRVLATTIR